jgi:hypothetical protein
MENVMLRVVPEVELVESASGVGSLGVGRYVFWIEEDNENETTKP